MNKRTIKDINQKDMNGVLYDLFLSYEKLSDRNEKLASAIFLLSDHIKDNEPVKNSLRQNATELITCYAKNIPIKRTFSAAQSFGPNDHGHVVLDQSYSYSLQIDKVHRFYDTVFQYISALTALVAVGQRSGMISSTNAEIMNQNLKSTLNELQLVYSRTVSPVPFESLMGSDFARGPVLEEGVRQSEVARMKSTPHARKPQTVRALSGHSTDDGKSHADSGVLAKESSTGGVDTATSERLSQDEKVKVRQQHIVDFIKGHPASTISDIIAVVTGYSEKTVQRELINLIGQNVLRREGERRWSRYSVVSSI